MVRADSDGEYQGAVAGQAEGELTGNRYLLEDLAGLDGVDYEERAQGLDFAAFSQLDGIPEDFLTFSYRFVADGQTVAEIPFRYGEDLDLSQVPQPPGRDGQYGQWPQFPTRDLRRSMVLQAQYLSPTSTLADQNGVARLLVEGTFSPEAALTVREEEPPLEELEDCQVLSAWSYEVTGSQSDTVTIRLRSDGAENPGAAVWEDGVWRRADATLDGSYLVFSGPVQGKVVLLDEGASHIWIWALGLGAAVLLGAGGAVVRKRRTSKDASPEESGEKTAAQG